jgi:gluconolactonase
MKTLILTLLSCLATGCVAITQSTSPPFISNKLEKLFGDGVFTEAVAVAPGGTVYFCDITNPQTSGNQVGHLYQFEPITGRVSIFRSPEYQCNGMKFTTTGDMITAHTNNGGSRNVVYTNMRTGKSHILASGFNSRPFNSLNDLVIDAKSCLYVTDPRYVGTEPIEQSIFGVYRIDPNGKVTPVITNLEAPNGIAISPDQKTLYITEHPYMNHNLLLGKAKFKAMSIKAYDLHPDGHVTFRKTVVDYGVKEGADGLIIDDAGNLYAAVRDEARPGIRIYSPAGQEIGYIPTPEKPTNLAFGGDHNTLYITAAKSLYRVQVQHLN